MKPFIQIEATYIRRAMTSTLILCASGQLMAQAPSSLSYPTPSVFVANVSNVFLSPNLAGNVTSYSISPALPAGLSFNTNTGVISGVPTAASTATSYTITATGPAGSTNTQASIQVTNNFFDNNYNTINFGGSGVTLINGSNGNTISNSTTSTVGPNAGDIVVYRNVATLSGQAIDCIVKTVSVTTGTSFNAYDQNDVSGTSFSNNDPRFFSPQVVFPNGTASGPGGTMQFSFQFILGGTYSTTTHTGLPVVLQNVKINTYDIDGNSQSNSNQSNEFGGFTTSEVGNATSLQTPTYNTTTGLTTYRSNTTTNSTVVTADPTRVRITYNNISDFTIRMGGGGTAYFFLDFSAGPAFSTAVPTTAPSIDLNTDVIGVNNAGSGCGTNLSFTPANQTNITTFNNGSLSQLSVSFPVAEIVNGANEKLIVSGATNGTIALNTDPSISNLTLGTATYAVAGSTSGGIRTLVFTRTSGTFTLTNAEALLDAFQYNNAAATPTPGSRNFTVNVRNTAFQSPNAIFTATLNCVSISGNVFHDVNAMVDNTVNATGASQFAANDLYVVCVNPSNNQVIDVKGIAAGGAYTFGTVTPGAYGLYLSTSAPVVGTTFTTPVFPANYVPTAEHLGAGPGTDNLTDGKMLVTIGSESITDANFGLQIPPTTSDNTINNVANPGGYNDYILPNGSLITDDADGTVDSIVINSFPANAQYIKIGSVVYTSGGTCPPQVSSCTPWPGSVVVPFSGGNPVPAVSVDPAAEGNTSVTINFTAWDNGRALSDTSNLTINFVSTAYYNISGKVWQDANGNGLKEGSEAFTAPADAGQTLYALLVQQNHTYSGAPTILSSSVVDAATGYSFTNVPGGNDYSIQIASLVSAPVSGAALSTVTPHLADGWVGVSTAADGVVTPNLNTNDPEIALPGLNATQSNMNFGIERLPESTSATTDVPYPSVGTLFTLDGTGSNPPVPSGVDPEDGPLRAGNTIVITSLPTHTTLLYDNTPVVLNQVISNFDPSKLKVQITVATVGQSNTSFQFSYRDAAGRQDPTPAIYTLNWGTPLPVALGSFTAAAQNDRVRLDWITYSEKNNKGFAIERSADGRKWKEIAFVATAAENGNSSEELSYTTDDKDPVSGVNYYRLKQTDKDEHFVYSEVRQAAFGGANAISIYPNPATDIINVNVSDWSKVASVSILDASGKVLFVAEHPEQGIHLEKLSKGTYILQVIQTNEQVASFKIVKQ